MKRFYLIGSLAVFLGFIGRGADAAGSAEDNWPEWRGPLHDGTAPHANPPIAWSETNNIKWKIRIPGDGSATPVVWGDRIFVQTAIPSDKKEPAAAKTAG